MDIAPHTYWVAKEVDDEWVAYSSFSLTERACREKFEEIANHFDGEIEFIEVTLHPVKKENK